MKNKKAIFEKVFDPKNKKDINSCTIEIKNKKGFSYTSQIGLLMALTDAKQIETIVYSIKKVPKVKPIMAEFSIIKK